MRMRVMLTLAAIGSCTGVLALEAAAAPALHGHADGEANSANAKAKSKDKGKGKAKRGTKSKKGQAKGHVDAEIRLSPKGARWGISLKELAQLWEAEFDRLYLPKYKRVEPGPRMKELDAEVADKKQYIRRNHIEFGSLPSGLDNTPLGVEFSYDNSESMTRLKLPNGDQDYYFFHNGGLYKTYKVKKLSKKSKKLGRNFEQVVEKLTKQFKSNPDRFEADREKGFAFDGAQWTNGDTILRILDQGGSKVAIVYIDHRKEEKLAERRAQKKDKDDRLSPDVAAVTKDKSEITAPPPR